MSCIVTNISFDPHSYLHSNYKYKWNSCPMLLISIILCNFYFYGHCHVFFGGILNLITMTVTKWRQRSLFCVISCQGFVDMCLRHTFKNSSVNENEYLTSWLCCSQTNLVQSLLHEHCFSWVICHSSFSKYCRHSSLGLLSLVEMCQEFLSCLQVGLLINKLVMQPNPQTNLVARCCRLINVF